LIPKIHNLRVLKSSIFLSAGYKGKFNNGNV
jgi:hypothetical protein